MKGRSRLSCSSLTYWPGAHVVRWQGKCRVYSLRARKDAVEALPLVVSGLKFLPSCRACQGLGSSAARACLWLGSCTTGREPRPGWAWKAAPLATAPKTAVTDRRSPPSRSGGPLLAESSGWAPVSEVTSQVHGGTHYCCPFLPARNDSER